MGILIPKFTNQHAVIPNNWRVNEDHELGRRYSASYLFNQGRGPTVFNGIRNRADHPTVLGNIDGTLTTLDGDTPSWETPSGWARCPTSSNVLVPGNLGLLNGTWSVFVDFYVLETATASLRFSYLGRNQLGATPGDLLIGGNGPGPILSLWDSTGAADSAKAFSSGAYVQAGEHWRVCGHLASDNQGISCYAICLSPTRLEGFNEDPGHLPNDFVGVTGTAWTFGANNPLNGGTFNASIIIKGVVVTDVNYTADEIKDQLYNPLDALERDTKRVYFISSAASIIPQIMHHRQLQSRAA